MRYYVITKSGQKSDIIILGRFFAPIYKIASIVSRET